MNIQNIINETQQSPWQPKFKWVNTIKTAADLINQPHEDYPIGITPTIDMINDFIDIGLFSWNNACNIQKYLFDKKMDTINGVITRDPSSSESIRLAALPNQHINLGLRRTTVQVGQWVPPNPIFLQDLVDRVFPVFATDEPVELHPWRQITSIESLINWYKIFQTVHPFEDLNGRVGGIIVAVISYELTGKFLAPNR